MAGAKASRLNKNSSQNGGERAASDADPISTKSLGEIGLQQFAPYLMNRIMGRYNHTLRDELSSAGLTTPKMRALAILSIMDGLKINELAVYAVVEQSTLSRSLDALETEGLIRREAPSDDNRVRHIFITDLGRGTFSALWPTMFRSSEAMFTGIDVEERERFVGTLHKILRNIRKHDI
ncbi:MarR family transcriptional regulator [Mesorhizobium sp. CAU 1732]|uniref:MarR family winged helix-turn-helix transcriptional regulator n=1 Tax=Mesorhizobium sp. CAU 1732 TaxID=3140358 RepID=UPI003260E6E5